MYLTGNFEGQKWPGVNQDESINHLINQSFNNYRTIKHTISSNQNLLLTWNLLDRSFSKCKFFRFAVSMLIFEESHRNISPSFSIKMLLVVLCRDSSVIPDLASSSPWEILWKTGCSGKSSCHFKLEPTFAAMLLTRTTRNITVRFTWCRDKARTMWMTGSKSTWPRWRPR